MAPDIIIPSESVTAILPIPSSKRRRGRPRKHVHIAHILSLLSNKALTEPNHVYTSHDRDKVDPLVLLARKLEKEESSGLENYDALSQLDVAEPQTYYQAMNSAYSEEWSRSINDEHNSLLENNTWDLVSSDSIEPGHIVLRGREVYKLKRDIDGKITRFKSRRVVKGYLQ